MSIDRRFFVRHGVAATLAALQGNNPRLLAAPRSGHDVTGLDINFNLDFPEAQVGCEAALNSEAVIWLQTAA